MAKKAIVDLPPGNGYLLIAMFAKWRNFMMDKRGLTAAIEGGWEIR